MLQGRPRRTICLAPGPTEIPPELQRYIETNRCHHRSPEFKIVAQQVRHDLLELFGAPSGKALIFRGGGRTMMEAAITNLYRPGDELLLIVLGKFGEEWRKILQKFNVSFAETTTEWGYTYDHWMVNNLLEKNRFSMVLIQAGETSTGVKPNLDILGDMIRRCSPETLLVGDAVLEGGISPLKMDRSRIDVLIGASQKAFMLPPGMGYVILGSRALDRLRSETKAALPVSEFDFREEIEAIEKGTTRFTPPIDQIVGLHMVLNHVLRACGEDRWYEQYRGRAERVRTEFKKLGFLLFPRDTPTNGINVLTVPAGMSAVKIQETVKKAGFYIETGQGQLKDSVVRIANFLGITDQDIKRFLREMKRVVKKEPRT